MENIDNVEINKPQPLKNEKKPKKGKALHGWSIFFFVLTVLGTILTGIMLILPVFLGIAGIFSGFVWFIVIVFLSLITIFTIWTNEGFKSFIDGWKSFNEKLLDSTNDVGELTTTLIPGILIGGAIIILITWLFLIIGIKTDQVRKKQYKGKIIAHIIMTVIYIVFLIVNLYRYYFL